MRLLKKCPIHPSFILLFLWFVVTLNFGGFFIFVGVVLTHEFGHYFIAKKLGYKLDSFFLAPYGVSLNYKDKTFESHDEIKIALAGPCVNFCLAFLSVSLWWLFPESYLYTYEFVIQSIMLGLFNLLPAYPLDGGRIFISILNSKLSRKKAVKITMILNVIFSMLFLLIFFITCFIDFNPTFVLVSVFMILGIFQSKFECKYEKLFMFKKNIKNFSKVNTIYIKSSSTLSEAIKHIELNKHTIFYIVGLSKTKFVDERSIIAWSMKYPISVTFEELLKL